MIVVADTSPINYLLVIGHIDLLQFFYGRVLIPASVWNELQDTHAPEQVRSWAANLPEWVEVRNLTNPPDSSLEFLDSGERDAIALVLELGADRLIADESLARQEAIRRNLFVIGTLGVLRNAARANLLQLHEALAKLQQTSFYVAPELIQSLLEEDAAR
jgi:predicted nucleic acid-binding protein